MPRRLVTISIDLTDSSPFDDAYLADLIEERIGTTIAVMKAGIERAAYVVDADSPHAGSYDVEVKTKND